LKVSNGTRVDFIELDMCLIDGPKGLHTFLIDERRDPVSISGNVENEERKTT